MKNLILGITTAVVLFLSQDIAAQAEKGAYVSINAGYGFGAGNNSGEVLGSTFGIQNSTQNTATSFTTENANVCLGKGLNFGATFGYMFNKHVGGELGINYLMGGKSDIKETRLSGDFTNSNISAKMLQFRPAIVISGGYSKINPYAKFGIVLGVANAINLESDGRNDTDSFKSNVEFSGNSAIGFHGGAGLLYSINDKISLFGELNLVNLNYSPEKASLTEFSVNGANLLPEFEVSEKETVFVDSVNSDSSTNANSPSQELKTTFNLGSLGLNFGMRYNF